MTKKTKTFWVSLGLMVGGASLAAFTDQKEAGIAVAIAGAGGMGIDAKRKAKPKPRR